MADPVSFVSVINTALNIACVGLLVRNEHRFTRVEVLTSMLVKDNDRRKIPRCEYDVPGEDD